jgi:hypothetical protein
VAERGGLENRCASNRTQGSNPCLSAMIVCYGWLKKAANVLKLIIMVWALWEKIDLEITCHEQLTNFDVPLHSDLSPPQLHVLT